MKNGEQLELTNYYQEFKELFWQPDTEFWKLERGQHYVEPSNDSWNAFNAGHWQQALDLLENDYDNLVNHMQKERNTGVETHRIRIVETPITPYLQWELALLRLRNQAGGPIRVLSADAITPWERTSPFPDLNIIFPDVAYEIHYDHNGAIHYATRYTDITAIRAATHMIRALYRLGEPIERYYQREIAHLPEPVITNPLPDDYLQKTGRPRQERS